MYPYITVFGRQFSSYILMASLGVIVCILFCVARHKKWTQPDGELDLLAVVSCFGVFVGSKLLFLLTVFPEFVADFSLLATEPLTFLDTYFGSGYVFYGGVYGGIVTAVIYSHFNHLDIWEVSRFFMPCIPLFHVFGRIGCFLAGCCYGVESETFGLMFSNSSVAPNDVPLFPIQLVEATCELLLFVLIWYICDRRKNGCIAFCAWVMIYGCVRFILEFFRGDEGRGFVGVFSTSQIFAVLSILLGVFVLAVEGLCRTERDFHEKFLKKGG